MAFKWESLKPMPTKRVFASTVFHEDNLYVIGGCDERGIPLDCFEMYNSKQKRWHRLQNMPTKRAAPAVAAVGNKIVAVAGVSEHQKPLDVIEIYDISEKKWTSGGALEKKLLGISCVVKDDKVYLMGGMAEDTNPRDLFAELDLETNCCQAMPPLITPRYATFAFLVHDKIYLLGGRKGKEPVVAFEEFDFSTRKWSKLPDIPSKRVFALYIANDTHIFSVGGLHQPATQGFSDACEMYDIEKGEWKICKSMPTKRGDFAIGMINNKVVCAGGLGNEGKPMKTLEVFNPDTNSWLSEKDMPSTHCSCCFTMHHDRLYIGGGLSCRGPSNCVEYVEFS